MKYLCKITLAWSWWACRVAAAAAERGSELLLWRVASADDRSSRIFLYNRTNTLYITLRILGYLRIQVHTGNYYGHTSLYKISGAIGALPVGSFFTIIVGHRCGAVQDQYYTKCIYHHACVDHSWHVLVHACDIMLTASFWLYNSCILNQVQSNGYTMIIHEHPSHRSVHTEMHYMYVYDVYLT